MEEVGKRIVKAIPNVLQQLSTLSSSQDQVMACSLGLRSFALLFVKAHYHSCSLLPPPPPSLLLQATARYAAAALKSLS